MDIAASSKGLYVLGSSVPVEWRVRCRIDKKIDKRREVICDRLDHRNVGAVDRYSGWYVAVDMLGV